MFSFYLYQETSAIITFGAILKLAEVLAQEVSSLKPTQAWQSPLPSL